MTVSLNGTVAADRTPWAGLFPMSAAAPITAAHLGIEYRGKVVREARWSGGLGQASGDGWVNERWQDFLQIVQASELSSLANTLDNDLVTFIKQVLD